MVKLVNSRQKSPYYDPPGMLRYCASIPKPHSPIVSIAHVLQFLIQSNSTPQLSKNLLVFITSYFLHKISFCLWISILVNPFFSFALPVVLNIFVVWMSLSSLIPTALDLSFLSVLKGSESFFVQNFKNVINLIFTMGFLLLIELHL